MSDSLMARFWAKVNKEGPIHPKLGTRCWLWTGNQNGKGYGHIAQTRIATIIVHRLSWEIHNGDHPGRLFVLHKCDTRSCVNPDHLFLGTHKDNMADCVAKGRFRNTTVERLRSQTHCKWGHEFTLDNTRRYPPKFYRHCRICSNTRRLRQKREASNV